MDCLTYFLDCCSCNYMHSRWNIGRHARQADKVDKCLYFSWLVPQNSRRYIWKLRLTQCAYQNACCWSLRAGRVTNDEWTSAICTAAYVQYTISITYMHPSYCSSVVGIAFKATCVCTIITATSTAACKSNRIISALVGIFVLPLIDIGVGPHARGYNCQKLCRASFLQAPV